MKKDFLDYMYNLKFLVKHALDIMVKLHASPKSTEDERNKLRVDITSQQERIDDIDTFIVKYLESHPITK